MDNKTLNRKELINAYLEFFKSKKHKKIPSAPLTPEKDPTVLFTTAGMHPLVPYLLGQEHPLGKRIVSLQRCIRTTDIDNVGDKSHHTFFEMLGNWSLGDYWKKEAISWSLEFLTEILKLDINRISITCFKGEGSVPKDEESARIWMSLGIPKERIVFLGKKENWWGPAGKTGPCGPDTEIFYWAGKENPPKRFNPKDTRWVEIWNDVFMEYEKNIKGEYNPLKQKNVDTGMGLERTLAVVNKIEDNYLTETFLPIIKKIEKVSKKDYKESEEIKKTMRIIADHIKASIFIVSEGVYPSNTERGYVLRRLIRRLTKYAKINLSLEGTNFIREIAEPVFEIYGDSCEELKKDKQKILKIIEEEKIKFDKTIQKGLKILEKKLKEDKVITCKDIFLLYQSYGFPLELTEEISKEKNIQIDKEGFQNELKKHQELSQISCKDKFKSGLADCSERTIKLHTLTHLLNESLRKVLDKNIKQKGSNITPERLRFDFNFNRKLSEEEIKKVEDFVNKKILEGISVKKEKMLLKKAIKIGAQAEFGTRYPEVVDVYSIGSFSKEICSGPHVKNTKEIGRFKILKEESVASGIRRIKATID
ncbi:alanine--tRNA ligase [Patescibacteria group bacterium]|nr:alanine--tRNA ligase [Patescibacteria group bacterium]